jgi:polyhydroxyalkanoate synthesis regulator phasin
MGQEKIMNKRVMAGLTAAGILTGGASAVALVAGGGVAPAGATVAAAYSAPRMPCAGNALNSLIRKGTITQAQATAVQKALGTYMRDQTGRMGWDMASMRRHMGDMTAHGPMATVMRQLVSKGTITRTQATAIIQQMRTHCGHGHGAGMMGNGHMG